MEKNYWEGKEYSYFSHKNCEFFPCHKGADQEDFNCLFCYCPLQHQGINAGGNFHYNEKGFKDCTNCQLPHKRKNYGYVTGKYQELADLMKKVRENQDVKEKVKQKGFPTHKLGAGKLFILQIKLAGAVFTNKSFS